MNFNNHSRYAGLHAKLSASNYHWINYSDEKFLNRLVSMEAAAKGTRLHDLAHDCIKENVKIRGDSTTLAMYVNDAIGLRMTPELLLFVNEDFFGTADTISFRKNKLRIHDLKTGVTEASEHQLEVYAAMFCLEYNVKPYEIDIEMRIYQNDDRVIYEPDPADIVHIMDKGMRFSRLAQHRREQELV